MFFLRTFLLPCCLLVFGCTQQSQTPPLLELLSPERTGIHFSNVLQEDENLNILTFEYFYNGAGVGIGDFNRDGWQDIFFSSNMGSSQLYLNQGNFTFQDVTEKAGIRTEGKWATGVSVVDINQDGWSDIYLCFAGPWTDPQKRANELYINQGDNTFREQAAAYGLADAGHSVQAAFLDYDRDGDLDMYLLTNMTDETGPNIIRKKRVHSEMLNTDRLYRNNGDHTFTDVSQQANITIEGYGLGVSVTDINQDGWPDLYVSNDYLSNDLLWVNNQDGTFTDRAADYFRHTSYSAMGHDVADFNNDGKQDIITLDMLPADNYRQKMMFGTTPYDRHRSELHYGYAPQFMRNTLQLNQGIDPDGQPVFSEISQLAGIDATDWSWSALWADLDNDGWRDLVVTNGYPRDITNRDFASYKAQELMNAHYDEPMKKRMLQALSSLEGAYIPNYVFQNQHHLTFQDRSAAWGFTQPSYSTGAAYADLDNDGDLDLVINNTEEPAFVYQNHAREQSENHYLQIQLQGPPENRQGYGASLSLYYDSLVQYHEHYPVRGFQSTVAATVHFGLGKHAFLDSLLIRWPDGREQHLTSFAADQVLTLEYHNSQEPVHHPKSSGQPPLFQEVTRDYQIAYQHQESHYADFKVQPLLPHKLSQNGPGLAVGDMNGDGREDFFIGGAFKQSGQLMFQQKDGRFVSLPLTTQTQYEEDMGALLFDADQDHDLDLYVVSGGNEFPAQSPYYQDRLYLNDGQGHFTLAPSALPQRYVSGSCVVAADYDQDGDLDLFVGGRLLPQQYPASGQSQLLENQGGHFTDVTVEKAPGLQQAGMVSAALWTDYNNDHQVDLILAGEWMPITVFQNNKGRLSDVTEALGLSSTTGWWNSLHAADFDQDGDTDYVLGNLGLNSRYQTSAAHPLQIHMADFNDDGRQEAILSTLQQGKRYPIHPRDDMLQQILSIKKKFPLYADYARATMQDLFSAEKLAQATEITCHTLQSSYLENKGTASWLLQPLPVEAQLAPVYGMSTGDYDQDGFTDLLLTGNSYATEVLSGRYDALNGLLLKGNGKGQFQPLSNSIFLEKDAKGLAEIKLSNHRTLLLAACNNDSLKVFEGQPDASLEIPVRPDDAFAIATHLDGIISKHELYFGSGYLSQSSRVLLLPLTVREVTLYNFKGEARGSELPGIHF